MSLQRTSFAGGHVSRPSAIALLCMALAVSTLVVYLGQRVYIHLQHGAAPVTLARTSGHTSGIAAPKPQQQSSHHVLSFMPTSPEINDDAINTPQAQVVSPQAEPITSEPAKHTAAASNEERTFDGRPIRPVRNMQMLVTAYSPDQRSCGKWADGYTASGYSVFTNGMNLVAADTRLLPFGTLVSIPGYNDGKPVPVLDRGGAIKGRRLDVLYPTHQRARQWGTQRLNIIVWEYAD